MTAAAQMLTVRVLLAIRKRGGRKVVVTPDAGTVAMHARVDVTLVKALARAFRWRRLLETGRYGTIAELAAAEKINESYVSRVLRLTLLAPEIVEAILDGRQPAEMMLPALMTGFPVEWHRQGWGAKQTVHALADAPSSCRTRSTQNATPCGSAASLKS
jgi:hypothetical protein